MTRSVFLTSCKSRTVPEQQKSGYRLLLFLLGLSIITVTLCSKSSPLYPINNWDDANCFMTVGKSVFNGQVLYRDIFEQKGPLLYFIYGMAGLISHNSFFGAYLIEIIAAFFFLLLCSKTLMLFCSRKILLLLPVLTTAIYAAPAFEQGGSAEELCLPLVMYSVYAGVKALVLHLPVKKREWLFIGVTSGAVLWIKFSLLGFYIGFGLFMLTIYLINRWNRDLIGLFFFLMLGLGIISAPVLIYFAVNNAVSSLFEVYFYCNLFLYPVKTVDNGFLGILLNLKNGFVSYFYNFWISFVFILSGLFFSFLRSKRLFILLLSAFITAFLMIYGGGRCYTYYPLILAVFMPFGLITLYHLTEGIITSLCSSKTRAGISAGLLSMLSCCLILLLSPNTYMMGYQKHQLPQFAFADIVRQNPEATLLNYHFLDGGFYLASDTLPVCLFFCELNLPFAGQQQDRYVQQELTDYIVTRDDKPIINGYECIANASFETRKNIHNTYYLYQKLPKSASADT